MEKIRGLYKITNEYSGLFYIGKSVDIYKRWITHKRGSDYSIIKSSV